MDNRKQQPFYVGQRVVCVNVNDGVGQAPQMPTLLRINNIYAVIDIVKSCCGWDIHVGFLDFDQPGHWVQCGFCGAVQYTNDNKIFHSYKRFAPYDPPAIEIPAELLEVDVKDGIDVKPVKELI